MRAAAVGTLIALNAGKAQAKQRSGSPSPGFLNSVIESVMRGALAIVIGIGIHSFMVGVWLYVMIAGVSYTIHSTERAAKAEATAARAQLSALRSQLNPHFLFNALHTMVQLIPRQPRQAADAAKPQAGPPSAHSHS